MDATTSLLKSNLYYITIQSKMNFGINERKNLMVFACGILLVIGQLCFIFKLNQRYYYNGSNYATSAKILNKTTGVLQECTIMRDETSMKSQMTFGDDKVYPKRVPLYENQSIDFACLNQLSSNKTPKTILMWTKFKGLPFPDFDQEMNTPGFFERINCPVTACRLTNDRSMLSQSGMVLFHLRNAIDFIPQRTSPHQSFVHVVFESPIHCFQCPYFNDTFTLTANYAAFSDFSSVYFTQSGLYWSPPTSATDQAQETRRDFHSIPKKEFGAALISNCDDKSMRLTYLQILNEHLRAARANASVNIYGKCGDSSHVCPTTVDSAAADGQPDCRSFIAARVRFYFAFENSVCRDYITEKFFDLLRYDVVPVVLGANNYDDYVPRSGFINALDFDSPKLLADYLLYLDANATAYNEYFAWKRYVRFRDERSLVREGYLCEMCVRMHLEEHGLMEVQQQRLNTMNEMFDTPTNCKRAWYDAANHTVRYTSDDDLKPVNYLSPE